eukprot:Em0008g1221a
MASPTALKRLRQDYLRLTRDPVPYIEAVPQPSNILEWHYVVKGPEDTPYYGGYYHGVLLFPKDYPFKPPRISMSTPNGRFQINTRLCLSISDFHPDTWNPAWSVATILTGLLSFMVENTSTLGSIETSDEMKRKLAVDSLAFNLNDQTFCQLFPKTCEEIRHLEQQRIEKQTNEASRDQHVCPESPSTGSSLRSFFSTMLMVFAFGALAFLVKHVLQHA